jgi:membrane-associated phospholipid phosphatase
MALLSWSERVHAFRRSHWFFRWFTIPASIAYLGALKALGGLGPEHFILVAIVLGVSLWSDRTRHWAKVIFPVLLYGLVYDSMRWYADYLRSPVIHIREPYEFDQRFFGVHVGGKVLTPAEFMQLHTAPVLDFITGVAYFVLFFVGESIALALWLFGKGHQRRALRFIWVFVITNFLGFSLYYLYPAAPPWYVSQYGFTLDMSARASAAGALRFDQIVGLPLMAGFYGKSADVFGAIPSLHVAYPFLAVIYSWPLRRFRWVAVAYFLLVCFSAVYLNHHYVIDILVGVGLSIATSLAFRFAGGPLRAEVPAPAPARVDRPLSEPTRA